MESKFIGASSSVSGGLSLGASSGRLPSKSAKSASALVGERASTTTADRLYTSKNGANRPIRL